MAFHRRAICFATSQKYRNALTLKNGTVHSPRSIRLDGVEHDDDDQVVPIEVTARIAAKVIQKSMLKVYPDAPHALTTTYRDRLNTGILEFLKSTAP